MTDLPPDALTGPPADDASTITATIVTGPTAPDLQAVETAAEAAAETAAADVPQGMGETLESVEPAPETPASVEPAPETLATVDGIEPVPASVEPAPGTVVEDPAPTPVSPAPHPHAPALAPAPAVAAAVGPAPETYGRVDPDGTVWVRTETGEVQVGQFQAGSPDEALAYYTRKYTALETEVVLLEQRLSSGADVAVDEAAATVARINEALATPQVVGDVDGLRIRVAALSPAIEARRAKARAAKAKARAAAKAVRETIVSEAEGLAESTSWKTSGDRLRALLEEWKVAPRVDRGTEQALWKRFSAARNTFDRRRRAHFAKLSSEQGDAKATKAALVKEAEALSTSTDWAATAAEFRRLMDRWKAAGRASRSDDDALWTRFRAAQDTFFSARSAAFDERDAGQADNLKAKEALAVEAEALLPLGDLTTAKASLRDIQERWEKVGHVPRGDKERIEGRLRRVEQTIREAEDSKWKRTNPEARARAEATVEQLTTAIGKLEKALAKAEASGDAKSVTETAEALAARRAWLAQAERAVTEFSGG